MEACYPMMITAFYICVMPSLDSGILPCQSLWRRRILHDVFHRTVKYIECLMDRIVRHIPVFFVPGWFFAQREEDSARTVNSLHLLRLQEIRLHPYGLERFKQLFPKTIQRSGSRRPVSFNEPKLREEFGSEDLCFPEVMVPL
jgi:hypothetical protein